MCSWWCSHTCMIYLCITCILQERVEYVFLVTFTHLFDLPVYYLYFTGAGGICVPGGVHC